MIRTDLGIATAYAEAVSKGYNGTRDEFGQMFADFGKTAEKVTEDKKAVEQMKASVEETKSSVDTTAAEFGQNVADKTAEAKAAITEHANTEKESATAAISEAKDVATGAITEAQTSATDAIASAKDSATAEITKKGTDTLATIPDDYTALTKEVGSLKEDLSNKITKFYASNQGEIHVTDSDNGKIMDMMLYGKSEQKQYSGKNLLNPILRTTVQNGVTCTNNGDGTYTVNGTATGSAAFVIYNNFADVYGSASSLKMVGCPSGGSSQKYFLRSYRKGENPEILDEYGSGISIGSFKEAGSNIAILVKSGATVNNLIFKPMLTTDTTATYENYEPYTGGIPSPNPSYPQEIKSVVNPVVKVRGKNLLPTNFGQNITALRYDAQYNRWAFDALKAVGLANARIIDPVTAHYLLSAGTYTITLVSFENVQNVIISAVDADWKTLASVTPNRPSKTFSVDANTIVGCYFVPKDANATGYLQVQLELGTTPTSYEPYTEQSVQLPYTLNAIPVTSGGNVTINGQQYIADYVDVERGKLVKKVSKITVKGSNEIANWRVTNQSKFEYAIDIFEEAHKYLEGLCENYIVESQRFVDKTIIIGIDGIQVLVCDSSLKSLNDVVLNFNSKPLVVYYPSDKTSEIELTPEKVQALKELSTNYPVTNISVTSDQLDGYTVFDYPISMANGWNYVKQQLNDNRDYIYDMDLQSAEAYVNSEYAVALTELEVM